MQPLIFSSPLTTHYRLSFSSISLNKTRRSALYSENINCSHALKKTKTKNQLNHAHTSDEVTHRAEEQQYNHIIIDIILQVIVVVQIRWQKVRKKSYRILVDALKAIQATLVGTPCSQFTSSSYARCRVTCNEKYKSLFSHKLETIHTSGR